MQVADDENEWPSEKKFTLTRFMYGAMNRGVANVDSQNEIDAETRVINQENTVPTLIYTAAIGAFNNFCLWLCQKNLHVRWFRVLY